MITFNDFKKIELKVGTIIVAENIEAANKLLRLKINTGEDENRQIIAGISKQYEPEELIDRQVVVVCNLEPKELMGEMSEGMLLAASDEETISLLSPDQKIKPGSIVR